MKISMASKLRAAQYVTKQNLTKAFGTFEGKMNRRFDRLEASIESLAEAVRQGFEGMDARFEATDRKIESVRTELKGDIASVQGDVRRIDSRWYRQQEMVDENRTGYRSLDKRVKVVEQKLGISPA